jgi:hypothetical protein
MKSVLAVVVGFLVVAAAYAQEREPERARIQPDTVDSRWSPWIGCWQPVEANESDARVCVSTAGEHGVTFATTVDGQTVLEETLVADGMEREVTDAECRGTQSAEWSLDGRRLFARADLICGGREPRRISGLAMIAPDGTWLDVQSSRVDSRENLRVRRYRRVADGVASFVPGGRSFTLDAVKEANRKVSAQVLEAALAETHSQFDLNSRNVIGLADAGVPERVIDLMIALSYPQQFIVERTTPSVAPPLLAPAFLAADPFDYRAYYYSPFAYMYSGFYYPYAFGASYPLVESGGSAPPRQSGSGQAIDGVGYTRVRQREPEPRATTALSGAGTSSTSSGAGSSSSGGGGSVSSSGYSAGGSSGSGSAGSGSSGGGASGGDSGRTAVPR